MTALATRLLRGTVALDRSRLDARNGLRTAVGVAIPLAVGLLVDRPLDGATAAGGAFFAGFAVFAGGYRTRVSSVLWATAGVAVSTFVGAAVGDLLWLFALTAALWGFAAGYATSLGLAAGIIGTQSVIGLLVITQYSMPLEDAAGRAALVAAGGLVQALLVVSGWPLRRSPVERRALGAVYRSLAAYAREMPSQLAPPDSRPLAEARTALGDPQPFARGDRALAFQSLHDEGERLRTTLAALAHARAPLAGVAVRADAVRVLDALAVDAASVLAQLAVAVQRPTFAGRTAALAAAGPQGAPQRWERMQAAVEALAQEAATAGPARAHLGPSLLGEVDRLARELLAHLRAAVTLTGTPTAAPARRTLTEGAVATLRANLTLRSAAYRHALRLAVVLGVGTALAGLLPFEHRYWLPLTALVVLRADFTSTFTRGLSRILGTAVGALVATGLAVVLEPGPYALAVLVSLTAFAGYTVLFANYALYGLAVTGFVVFLLSFTGLPGAGTVVDRIEATVLGGLLALLAYAVWPTWESVRAPEQLARLLEAQERYVGALLRQYAGVDRDPGAAQDLRAAARLARANAEASVDRVLAEPGGALAGGLAEIGAATRRTALAALALQVHLPQAGRGPAELHAVADALGATVQELAAALRAGRPPGPLPPLREAQAALRAALPHDLDGAVLDVEVEQLVGAVLEVADRLRTAGADPGGSGGSRRSRARARAGSSARPRRRPW